MSLCLSLSHTQTLDSSLVVWHGRVSNPIRSYPLESARRLLVADDSDIEVITSRQLQLLSLWPPDPLAIDQRPSRNVRRSFFQESIMARTATPQKDMALNDIGSPTHPSFFSTSFLSPAFISGTPTLPHPSCSFCFFYRKHFFLIIAANWGNSRPYH